MDNESDQVEILRRVCRYADLLPGYAFPIGLDIVDKYARIPPWMTAGFEAQIRREYGRLLAGLPIEMNRLSPQLLGVQLRGRANRPGV